MWAISPRGVIPWSPDIKQLKLTRWQSGQDYNILLSINFNNGDLPRDSLKIKKIIFGLVSGCDKYMLKNEDKRLSHDTRYYEYGYQCCIWDLGIILSEQSNYPIKIGPGPHQIVSADQVSGDHKHFTSPLPGHPDTRATKSQTVWIPAFKDPPLCLQKWPYFQELDQNHVSLSCGRPGEYLRSICNQFGFYQ